jgi:hypothetical protein
MKSKIGTMPNAYLKGFKYLLNYAAEICGEVTSAAYVVNHAVLLGLALAIQAHDPGSTTLYKNLRIKVLK